MSIYPKKSCKCEGCAYVSCDHCSCHSNHTSNVPIVPVVPKWPKPFKFCVYRDKESNSRTAKELGMDKTQEATFRYTALEVEFDGYITDRGEYFATAVFGVPITAPVNLTC